MLSILNRRMEEPYAYARTMTSDPGRVGKSVCSFGLGAPPPGPFSLSGHCSSPSVGVRLSSFDEGVKS